MISLLLVDDQPAVRQGWRMRRSLEADLDIIGEAGDDREAVALARRLMPNVVLMDIGMPAMDGIAATARLRESSPGVRVVVVSLHDAATCARP